MTVLGGYVTFKRGSVFLKTPLWVCFLLKAKVFCQIIYVVSVAERPVSKRQPEVSLDASQAVWGSWKKQLQRGVTPLYSAPLTFVEGARQRWDSPGLLKVMDVLVFASAHTSSSCRTKCLCILTSLSSRPQTPVIPVPPAPHLSLCTSVLHYFRDFHPVPWASTFQARSLTCSVSLSAEITSTPRLFGWLLWDALQIPGLSPTVPTARAAPGTSVKVSVESHFCQVS